HGIAALRCRIEKKTVAAQGPPQPGGGIPLPRTRIKRDPLGCRKIFEQKRISMRRRSGRPRANLEQKILAEMSQHEQRMEAIVAEKLGQNLIDRFLTSLAKR